MFPDYLLSLLAPEKRRFQAIYYTLTGKRTTSNLYAALDYGILQWLQIYPSLEQAQFQAGLKQLQAAELLEQDNRFVWLTPLGVKRRAELLPTLQWPEHYDGATMGHLAQTQLLFVLAVQVMSEYQHHNTHYYPLKVSLQLRSRLVTWFKQAKHQPEVTIRFKTELEHLFEALPEQQADIVANRLLGYQTLGLTGQQLEQQLKQTPFELNLTLIEVFATLLTQLQATPATFPLLVALLQPNRSPLSQSTVKTWQAFQAGQTLAEIEQHRRIKYSTLKEHLLEVAILVPNFPFERVLSKPTLDFLDAQFKQAQQPTFQQVQQLKPQFDFFDYRLYQIKQRVSS